MNVYDSTVDSIQDEKKQPVFKDTKMYLCKYYSLMKIKIILHSLHFQTRKDMPGELYSVYTKHNVNMRLLSIPCEWFCRTFSSYLSFIAKCATTYDPL